MPINTKHPMFNDDMAEITKNAHSGNVHGYIPRLVGQSNAEYSQYVERSTYFNVVRRTTSALIGAMLRKPMTTDLDLSTVNIDGGQNFNEFTADLLKNIMTTGRVGVLCDYDDQADQPYMVSYENGSIVNWRYDGQLLQFVVLREDVYIPKVDDPYEVEHIERYRELCMEDGIYTVKVWQQERSKHWTVIEQTYPTYRGQALDYIPFTFINTTDTTDRCSEPSLYNMAQINIGHYRTCADIEHAAHFTALPQPWLAGGIANEEMGSELPIGTFAVWQLDQDSTVGYLEFNGNGIKSLQQMQVHKEAQMVAIGSRMLSDKKGVESQEALRIRQGSESASLIGLVNAVESGLRQNLHYYRKWMGNDDEFKFTMNRDFTPAKMDPNELREMISAFVSGTISQQSFLNNLYKGEIIDDVELEMTNLSKLTPQPEETP